MAGLPSIDSANVQLLQEVELEMVSDLYNRMVNVCHRKCIPPKYRDGELEKGEAVCLDRCVAKYLEINDRIGKRLIEKAMQGNDFMKKYQTEQPSSNPE